MEMCFIDALILNEFIVTNVITVNNSKWINIIMGQIKVLAQQFIQVIPQCKTPICSLLYYGLSLSWLGTELVILVIETQGTVL